MFGHGVRVLAGLLLTAAVAEAQNRPGVVPGPALGTMYDAPFGSTYYPAVGGVFSPPYQLSVQPGYGVGSVTGFGGGAIVWPWYPYTAGPAIDPFAIRPPLPEVYAIPALPTQYLSAAVADRQRELTAAPTDIRTVLTVELPTAAELWVNGAVRPGGAKLKHAVSVPVGSANERVMLKLRADWTAGGKGFTFTDTQTLTAGDSKTLLVYNGTPTGK